MLFDDPFAPALPILTDHAVLTDARALIDGFGDEAGLEASTRADRSRDLGNVVHFARWRQVERLIEVLASDAAIGTVH
jgi:hypothetical protein